MKLVKLMIVILTAACLTFAILQGQQEDARPLPTLLPAGAQLYLEAKDFGALVKQWNSSTEKAKWLTSANFGVLSRSRLVQRLGQAQDEFANLAGVPVEYNVINEVAGDRSAFAFYDLANLKFVYLTKVDVSRLNNVNLWRERRQYQARDASGTAFYVKFDAATKRTIAMSSYKEWLVITTDEELMARTLGLLSGRQKDTLAEESWFSDLAGRSKIQGDLRLVYNLSALSTTPQFRTYWLQQNITELKQFKSGLADLFETPSGFEEQRILLRQDEGNERPSANLSEVLRYVPASASLYRAWSQPDRDTLQQSLRQVILAEAIGVQNEQQLAPVVSLATSDMGSSADFDTNIDQPPFRRNEKAAFSQIMDAVLAMRPKALVHVQSTVALKDGVFILPQSGVVVECEHPDKVAFEKVLPAVADVTQTGSLDPLQISTEGQNFIVTRIQLKVNSVAPSVQATVTYAAAFNKRYEWPRYQRLFALLDNRQGADNGGEPAFFSGNIQSLGEALSRLETATITSEDSSTELRETVRYALSAP